MDAASLFAKVWNELVDLTGLPAKYRAKTNEGAYHLLRRVGVPEDVAKLAIKHVPELAGEIASKIPVPFSGPAVKILVKKALERLLLRDSVVK